MTVCCERCLQGLSDRLLCAQVKKTRAQLKKTQDTLRELRAAAGKLIVKGRKGARDQGPRSLEEARPALFVD